MHDEGVGLVKVKEEERKARKGKDNQENEEMVARLKGKKIMRNAGKREMEK